MRRLLPLLVLSFLPVLVQAGTVRLSPSTQSVDNTMDSEDITLTYTPSVGARAFEVSVTIGLERLGWSKVEPVASPDAGVKVLCALSGGEVRALVFTPAGGNLPATTFTLCRLRVRPHAHTPSQTWYSIVASNAFETDASFNPITLANARSWVFVP